MAYTKTITDANTYYAATNHIKAFDWAQYSTDERTGGLAQAQREVEVYLNRDLSDPTAGDRYRDDYAIFEQALFILEETVRTRESTTGAELVETVNTEAQEKYYGVVYAPMAMRYMALQRRRIVIG